MDTVTTNTARQAFQQALREALDMYHPRWELGIKGREQRTSHSFQTVASETLHDWVNSGKKQCPQQKSFQAFLDEAEFPEETQEIIWAHYLAFKRERRQKRLAKETSSAVSDEYLLQQAVLLLPPSEQVNDNDIHDTMPLITPTKLKEYMSEVEHEGQGGHTTKWEAEALEADRGLPNVNYQVRKYIESSLDKVVEDIATNPKLKDFTTQNLANAVLKALSDVVTRDVTREAIDHAINFYREKK